jgi:isoprenylcysteine carboxyl methyltransferase (ICMT) family protein YpbQ
MRRILTEFYSLVHGITGVKLLAYISGLFYLSVFNCVIIKGVASLLQGWIGFVGILVRLFSFPFVLFTFVLMLGATYWITPAVQTVAKDAKKNKRYTTLLLYTLFGLLLFTYVQFGEAFFT